jgi:hypothetical protein
MLVQTAKENLFAEDGLTRNEAASLQMQFVTLEASFLMYGSNIM